MGLTAVSLVAIYLVGVEVNGARRWDFSWPILVSAIRVC